MLIIDDVWKTVKHINYGKDEKTMISMEPHCDINHHGSAGSMEADELIECFQVTEKDRKLRYINYLGDGDSKLFLKISKPDIYPQKQVRKLECDGHIQKRLSSRLRTTKLFCHCN